MSISRGLLKARRLPTQLLRSRVCISGTVNKVLYAKAVARRSIFRS